MVESTVSHDPLNYHTQSYYSFCTSKRKKIFSEENPKTTYLIFLWLTQSVILTLKLLYVNDLTLLEVESYNILYIQIIFQSFLTKPPCVSKLLTLSITVRSTILSPMKLNLYNVSLVMVFKLFLSCMLYYHNIFFCAWNPVI